MTWNPPSLNTDGSALTNSGSYLVTYGTSAGSLNQSVTVAGGTTTSKTIDGLAAGTYYFAVTAVNAAGVASTPSNPVARTLP